ncbi:MAG: F0F1 ATP synthase subunit B [Pseudonocardia sp.]
MQELFHFAAELVAFVLVVFLIYRFVWPRLRKTMEERQDAVQRQVQDSEEAVRNLEAAQRRFDEAVAEARQEAAKIRDDARADASHIRDEMREQAEREVERIRQRGEEQLAAQRDQVMRQLRAEIAALSFETARRKVVESLSDDTRRAQTVDTFLGELDVMSGQSTGSGTARAQARVEAGPGGVN